MYEVVSGLTFLTESMTPHTQGRGASGKVFKRKYGGKVEFQERGRGV